jgi:LysM domain-containing protein
VVYQDLNGNGERDLDEPGFGGAVVRRDGQVAVTDDHGRYRLSGDGREAQLDPRSLPPGWIMAGAAAPAAPSEFGVLPTAMLEVRVLIAPDAEGRAASVSLGPATIIARDSAGRSWLARVSEGGIASFDALPLGTYSIELELPMSSEPLLLTSPLPAVQLSTPRGITRMTVPLAVRPLKLWRPAALPQSESSELASRAASAVTATAASADSAPTPTNRGAAVTGTNAGGVEPPPARGPSLVAELTSSRAALAPRAIGEPAVLTRDYVVRPHDTLSGLAARFLQDGVQWPLLYDVNRAALENPDSLSVGQRLTILGFPQRKLDWHADSSSLFGRRVRLAPTP